MENKLKYTLRELRARNKFTQEDMANSLNVSRQRYIKIENNPSVVACKTLISIAEILKVDLGDIFFESQPHK